MHALRHVAQPTSVALPCLDLHAVAQAAHLDTWRSRQPASRCAANACAAADCHTRPGCVLAALKGRPGEGVLTCMHLTFSTFIYDTRGTRRFQDVTASTSPEILPILGRARMKSVRYSELYVCVDLWLPILDPLQF